MWLCCKGHSKKAKSIIENSMHNRKFTYTYEVFPIPFIFPKVHDGLRCGIPFSSKYEYFFFKKKYPPTTRGTTTYSKISEKFIAIFPLSKLDSHCVLSIRMRWFYSSYMDWEHSPTLWRFVCVRLGQKIIKFIHLRNGLILLLSWLRFCSILIFIFIICEVRNSSY